MAKKKTRKKTVATLRHGESKRTNIPTAEQQSVMETEEKYSIRVEIERRNRDLDPQLVWRGKSEQDGEPLVANAPPLYIQEKVHPKVLIDDLGRRSDELKEKGQEVQLDLFGDFNGLPEEARSAEFYQHQANWTNRMILGDSLQVMASLAEREGLRGKVQCIYFDPPYGIKFNSNFQWSTTSRDVKDGKANHITREPEQVKAFRDTWQDGIHSYLTYLRDRLTVARELLSESGSIFVQIGDENLHRIRAVLDEVFGEENFVSQITVVKTSGLASSHRIAGSADYIIWYAKDFEKSKYRPLVKEKDINSPAGVNFRYIRDEATGRPKRIKGSEKANAETAFRTVLLTKPGPGRKFDLHFQGETYTSGSRWWGTTEEGMEKVKRAGRLAVSGNSVAFFRAWSDYSVTPLDNVWTDTGTGGFLEAKIYVVQTIEKVVQRCILMATDPGDLVLDPTCGSGTTAYVAEQWGRRWITVDTSRVALALARSRIMGARYAFYLLADSLNGKEKEAEISRSPVDDTPTHNDIRHGFVYERVPHITLKSIVRNAEIDVIWEQFQEKLEPLRRELNKAVGQEWEEWEIPRESDEDWSDVTQTLHARWWKLRIERQKEIDASIAAKADFEYLYDKPYQDKSKVRVAGPFTVESLSPHRTMTVDENDNLIDPLEQTAAQSSDGDREVADFAKMVLENLKKSGVQQAHKEDKINFTSLAPWPGEYIAAEGRFVKSEEGSEKGEKEVGAGIFIGPEFGTISQPDLKAAARECGDAGFDVLIACGFNYEAHASEFNKLGRIQVLKARMNADMHMSADLKNTGKGNLFVIFGEPDITVRESKAKGAKLGDIEVQINGVDVFQPSTGEVRSDGAAGIACWFIDTDYNEESFFVRQAYFLGANDPYKSLKTTLKSEINKEAWDSLNSDTSRPFPQPKSGRIAVKVINHLGDEVMKVFRVKEVLE